MLFTRGAWHDRPVPRECQSSRWIAKTGTTIVVKGGDCVKTEPTKAQTEMPATQQLRGLDSQAKEQQRKETPIIGNGGLAWLQVIHMA